jgi:hypothetical protein
MNNPSKRNAAVTIICATLLAAGDVGGRTIEGQIFIVTRGGNSIKLGLVEVAAFPREEAQAAIVKVTEQLSAEREEIQKITKETSTIEREATATKRALMEAWNNARYGTKDYDKAKSAYELASELSDDLSRLESLIDQRRRYLFSSRPYFAALPPPIAKGKTDADGNFVLKLPMLGDFVVGANATRLAGSETEYYSWLVSTDPEGAPKLALSNDNMTSESGGNSILRTIYNNAPSAPVTIDEIRAQRREIVAKYQPPPPKRPAVAAVKPQQSAAPPIVAAPTPPPPQYITLTREVEILHGPRKIIIPKATKLLLVGRGAGVVQVRWQNNSEIIPISATDLANR